MTGSASAAEMTPRKVHALDFAKVAQYELFSTRSSISSGRSLWQFANLIPGQESHCRPLVERRRATVCEISHVWGLIDAAARAGVQRQRVQEARRPRRRSHTVRSFPGFLEVALPSQPRAL